MSQLFLCGICLISGKLHSQCHEGAEVSAGDHPLQLAFVPR